MRTHLENPNTGNRTVSWVVTDGTANSSAVYSAITVAAADIDAPSFGGAGGDPFLYRISEQQQSLTLR